MAQSRSGGRRLSDGVAERIVQLITSGSLDVGDRLPGERELAQSLGVSRPLVREGLRAVESLGLIEVKRGVGAIVLSTTQPDARPAGRALISGAGAFATEDGHELISLLERSTILDILEAREMLELDIVTLAVERITAEQSDWLLRAAERADSWNDNREFHITLASITRNFMLERLITMLLDLLEGAHQRNHYRSKDATALLLEQHRDIAEAVIAHDVDAARQRMRDHFKHTRETIFWNKR